ncbi:uncharacterized protein LOC109199742 isoform X2 [Oreochromis niloticus]|uniref:uncharacterized protein LOC109199742 isoform X2 n=1 Tax=Oreochromis niloticus TaxID=8128 RepID=UPI000DF14FBE|nr:uncharacterized protein LOC109199742 isoform X2 [Oreochromis niloticus]
MKAAAASLLLLGVCVLLLSAPTVSADSSAPPSSSSILILVVAGLVSMVLLVLVVWGVLWRKQKGALHSSSPVHVNCSDVTIRQRDTRRAKSPDDPDVIYSDVRTRTSGPDDVVYREVIFRR